MDTAARLRLLGDPTRLRLLRLLSRESLNVSELTGILGGGPVRRVAAPGAAARRGPGGGRTRRALRLVPAVGRIHRRGRRPGVAPRWLAQEFARSTPETRADDGRLEEVRRLRKDSFQTHGDERRQLVPGRSWPAWARALGLLLPAVDVADLGCGEGHLTLEAARWARRVIAVDRSKDVLVRGRELAKRRKLTNITWKQGELERLPIRRSVDRHRAAVAGAASRRPSGSRARRSVPDSQARRPAHRARSARARGDVGPVEARRSLARLQREPAPRIAARRRIHEDRGPRRRATDGRSVYGTDRVRAEVTTTT